MSPSQRQYEGTPSKSSSVTAKASRASPTSRAELVEASASASKSVALSRENTSSSAEQTSMSSSAVMSASTASASVEATDSGINAPVQKRRRITRACDECRRKKIKCDGRQPCLHCTVYTYECTYNQPSNRSRKPDSRYIESLEKRLQEAEALLKSISPDIQLGGERPASQQQIPVNIGSGNQQPSHNFPSQASTVAKSSIVTAQSPNAKPSVGKMAHFEIDNRGCCHYCEQSSGLDLIKQIYDAFAKAFSQNKSDESQSLGIASSNETLRKSLQDISATLFGSSSSTERPPSGMEPRSFPALPPTKAIYRLCEVALKDACALSPIVHEITFRKGIDQLISFSRLNRQYEDRKFMILLHAVLAVGGIHAKDERLLTKEKGFKHFRAAQSLLDITQCEDILSLQAVLFIILYLQLSGELSQCHFYIGVATRSAQRLGLHRSLSEIVIDNETSNRLNPVEIETRKRIFWAIYKLDTAISLQLGLPTAIRDEDIVQEHLAEVDDKQITEHGIHATEGTGASGPSAANAHTNLVEIVRKIVKFVHPIRVGTNSGPSNLAVAYSVDETHLRTARNQKVTSLKDELQRWHDSLPSELRPNGDAPIRQLRDQQLLRLLFAQAQMLLYRPFLYESLLAYNFSAASSRPFDEESRGCAAICIVISRNIIRITSDARSQYLLQRDYWFATYSTLFALFVTTCSLLTSPPGKADQEILADIRMGKDVIHRHVGQNLVASRCNNLMEPLFEKLSGEWTRDRSKLLKQTTERKQSLLPRDPGIKRKISTKASLPSPLGFKFDAPSKTGSDQITMKSAQQTRQQLVDDQQHARNLLEQKRQQYRDFMANIYPGHPASSIPASLGSSRNEAIDRTSITSAQQPSASHNYSNPLDVSNGGGLDNILASMPSASLSPSSNLNMPLADFSDLLYTPADPFAYPFTSNITVSAAGAVSVPAIPESDIEMADFLSSESPAAMRGSICAEGEGTLISPENYPPGMDLEWSQSEMLSAPVASASDLTPATVLPLANVIDPGGASDITTRPFHQQQQQSFQDQRLDDREQLLYSHLPHQEGLTLGPLRTARSKSASASESGSEGQSEDENVGGNESETKSNDEGVDDSDEESGDGDDDDDDDDDDEHDKADEGEEEEEEKEQEDDDDSDGDDDDDNCKE